MFALTRKTRSVSLSIAIGALALGLAGCGATTEAKKNEQTSEQTTSPADIKEEDSSKSSSNAGQSEPGTSDAGGEQLPGLSGTHGQTPSVPGSDQTPTEPGGSDSEGIEDLGGFPKSAQAKLDTAPFTADELKRGQALPGEMVQRALDGDYEGVCGMLVAGNSGQAVRLDAPEVKGHCVETFKEELEGSPEAQKNAEEALAQAGPEHVTVRDRGDGTGEFFSDGDSMGMLLVRLDDGNLRLMVSTL